MIRRELFFFIVIGFAQLAIDTGLLLFFVEIAGLGAWANILSRGLAASFGYVANSKLSFAHRTGSRLHGRQAFRYFVAWGSLTLLGTGLIDLCQGLAGNGEAWILVAAKLGSEAVLVGLSFAAFRWWVYRV